MKKGDKIIWDSGFGYEIGIFDNEKGVMYGTCQVYLQTGIAQGYISRPKFEIKPYSKDLIAELNIKYRYTHRDNL